MRIVVTGAGGRLGSALSRELVRRRHDVIALSRGELDITDAASVDASILRLAPDAIVNCSAYNAVDAAESDPARAFAINAQGPAILAAAAAEVGAVLVHFGTDFVFDGEATEPYAEDAPTRPLSVYGASKLAGEMAVRRIPQHFILRVESLFGGSATSAQRATVDYLADTLTAGLPVRAIVDRTVTPSYVSDVVQATTTLLEGDGPFGTYHCVASGMTTWCELATEIAHLLGVPAHVIPVRSEEFKTIARRPRFCALSNDKLLNLGIEMPSWRTALVRHLAARCTRTREQLERRVRIA